MTIGVDERSNSLIVSASDKLFQQVRDLVEELDMVALESTDDSTEVITLKGLNPEAMKAALQSIMGSSAVISSGSSSSSSRGSSTSSRSGPSRSTSSGTTGGMSPSDMQRRIEFFRAMQSRGGGGPPGGFGGRGGGPTSGGGRGGGR